MQKYIGTKQLMAKPMNLGDYNSYRGWDIPADEVPNREGYLVQYEDGYESWSPKEVFENAYRPTDHMNFGLAIEAAKKGEKISRFTGSGGWEGKNTFVFLREGRQITGVDHNSPMGGDFESLPHLCMRTADGKCTVGWLPSQADILSDDWFIVY